MGNDIHPSAVVHPGAQLGTDITVGPYSYIEDNTVVGDGTTIGAYAQIKACTTIGSGNQIHSYAYVGGDPQDYKYTGADTFLKVGDNNIIREFSTIHRGTEDGRGITTIGSGCMIMAYAHVAHDCLLGDSVVLANCVMLAGHVDIGDHTVLSGMCGVHQFTRIGEYSFVGGMSGVTMDVPPYMLVAGTRALLRGLNIIGLKRSGMSREAIKALKQAYRVIWREGNERQEALAVLDEELGDVPEVANLVGFIRASERGVLADGGKGARRGRGGKFEDE